MTKKLAGITAILFLCILTVLMTLFGQGYIRYKREIEALPLDQAVSAYTDDPAFVPFEQIDEDFINAVISVEDKRFFSRQGYDLVALCRGEDVQKAVYSSNS